MRQADVRLHWRASRARWTVLLGLTILLWPVAAPARLAACGETVEAALPVPEALGRLRESIDPCGESAQVLAVLEKVEHCSRQVYEVCPSSAIARNVFDRPIEHLGREIPRTIRWNPQLRTDLETSCAADPSEPLVRDPTASLLHELVHAAQDCDGLNPGEHELEAVRIENIYRRAVGLCQRPGYGETPLPASMVRSCSTSLPCSCSSPPGRSAPRSLPAISGACSRKAAVRGPDNAESTRDERRSARPGGRERSPRKLEEPGTCCRLWRGSIDKECRG